MDGSARYGTEENRREQPVDEQRAPKTKGSRVGIAIGIGLGVAFLGLLGVRLQQAVAKKAAMAEEGKASQAKPAAKERTRAIKPTPTTWLPRVDLTGTLKPWRDADVGFETPGR